MNTDDVKHCMTHVFLQSDEPLTLDDVSNACGLRTDTIMPVVRRMVDEGLLVEGQLTDTKTVPQYFWAAWWSRDSQRRTEASGRQLQAIVDAQPGQLAIDSEAVVAFNNYILTEYTPPETKRFLVFFQCSVRRPFSTSPSHASMRRAVKVATGHDPARDFSECPVHVVVLASTIGPVPYELEEVYPANVGGGGVKNFGPAHYERVRPLLVSRMAGYIRTHSPRYHQIAAFGDGRYGDVMRAAAQSADVEFPVFPDAHGARLLRIGSSRPRTYWQKYWVQLYQEIVSWLDPAFRQAANERLAALDVEIR